MWMLHEGRTLWWKLIAQCRSRPAGWWVTISWGVSSRAKTSGGRGVQRQQKDVLAARIVSFEPINFHLDKEAPCSVAAWQSWERWRSCKNFPELMRSDLNRHNQNQICFKHICKEVFTLVQTYDIGPMYMEIFDNILTGVTSDLLWSMSDLSGRHNAGCYGQIFLCLCPCCAPNCVLSSCQF